MIISHSKKFICLNPPKTGSRLREAIFSSHSDFDVIKVKSGIIPAPQGCYRHFNYSLAKKFLEKNNLNICDYFVFTFVRNPWDRVISWANMSFQIEKCKIDKELLIRSIKSAICQDYKQSTYYNIDSNIYKKINYIGSLETHDFDMKNISDILNLKLNLNVSPFRHDSFHEQIYKFWDEELIDIIRKEESETIDLMGYKFN